MLKKKQREDLKQRRIICYFIDAASDIIEKEGIDAITIRNVSDKAGYTSATLYNYFDNLNHLIFLASMEHLEEYNDDLIERTKEYKNPIDMYIIICKCYVEHSFKKPEIFSLLFFLQASEIYEKYTKQYYKLYPKREKKLQKKIVFDLLHMNNVRERALSLIYPCIEAGIIDEESAIDFTDAGIRIHKTILEDVKNNILDKEIAIKMTLKYYMKLLNLFIKPNFRHLTHEYKSYYE